MHKVFGPDTPARRILACLYLSIAVVSIIAIFSIGLRLQIILILFPFQIFYKLLTLYFIEDRKNPVPWCNLAISCLHAVSLYLAFQIQ